MKHSAKSKSVALLFVSAAIITVSYQNCSNGFQPISGTTNSSSGASNDGSVAPPGAGSLTKIIMQPQSQSVINGQSAILMTAADGDASKITYQWKLGGAAIAGATAATYETPKLAVAQNQNRYSVDVSDGVSTIQSDDALIKVYNDTEIPVSTEYIVAPSSTGAGILDDFGNHYVEINKAVAARGKLFLFFPASLSNPQKDQLIIHAAANNGFHTVGMAYPNSDVVALLCNSSSDKNCQTNIREETFTGNPVSDEVTVDVANSVINRVTALLINLKAAHPTDGWGQYLDENNAVRWDLVRVSGHSQGGGTAGYLAVQKSVDRVCTFSSPADYDNQGRTPSNWLFLTKKTAANRFYGFGHTADSIVPMANLLQIWTALGIDTFGAYLNVDNATSLGSGHMFFTSTGQASSGHSIPVVDSATPIDADGLPVFRKIWQNNCFQ